MTNVTNTAIKLYPSADDARKWKLAGEMVEGSYQRWAIGVLNKAAAKVMVQKAKGKTFVRPRRIPKNSFSTLPVNQVFTNKPEVG